MRDTNAPLGTGRRNPGAKNTPVSSMFGYVLRT